VGGKEEEEEREKKQGIQPLNPGPETSSLRDILSKFKRFHSARTEGKKRRDDT